MKYQTNFLGVKKELGSFMTKSLTEMFSGKLNIEGQTVSLPTDRELECKLKYSVEESGGSLTLKISWDNDIEPEEVSEKDND